MEPTMPSYNYLNLLEDFVLPNTEDNNVIQVFWVVVPRSVAVK